jgi:hypothetical protein
MLPSRANAEAFEAAVEEIASSSQRLLDRLVVKDLVGVIRAADRV